jgi:hypothetical protein
VKSIQTGGSGKDCFHRWPISAAFGLGSNLKTCASSAATSLSLSGLCSPLSGLANSKRVMEAGPVAEEGIAAHRNPQGLSKGLLRWVALELLPQLLGDFASQRFEGFLRDEGQHSRDGKRICWHLAFAGDGGFFEQR